MPTLFPKPAKARPNYLAVIRFLFFLLLPILALQGCTATVWEDLPFITTLPGPETAVPEPSQTPPPAKPAAEITFRVEIPSNTAPDQPVYLSILEEVTGLALSAQHYQMLPEDDRHHVLSLQFPIGSVVKYRYSRGTPPVHVEEHLSDGRQVRYRLYHVQAPGAVEDVISRWTDTDFVGSTGRISGLVTDSASGQPVPGLMVAAGGAQTLTASDGSYLLEGLLPGTHNLVVYAMDGTYQTFQQGARIESLATTPASIQVASAHLVNLVFVVSVPPQTIPAVPIRLAGNLSQLGNTFATLSGGMSTLANRMPVLSLLPDGRYTLTLTLPAGADVRYLYTLGDGYWNTEKTSNGDTNLRQLIVPNQNTQIDDAIESWTSGETGPITFDVTVPAITPPDDYVSIQFNPVFGWTEPIPMWSLGNNRWAYVLNSTPGNLSDLGYRFCRNDQCGTADDAETPGTTSPGYTVNPGPEPQTVVNTVEHWAWFDLPSEANPVPALPVAVRGSEFIAGVELQPAFHPSWIPRMSNFLNGVQGIGANWVVITPTWTFTRNSPPVIEPVTGRDPLWFDLVEIMKQGKERGLNMALFPTPRFTSNMQEWWNASSRDFPWWVAWFERYEGFILHQADFAASQGAQALILGGEWLKPALPEGTLWDGSPSGVPADAESRWRELIQKVRSRFSGQILWALPYSQAVEAAPAFLDEVDQIYLLWSEPLSNNPDPSQADMEAEAARLIDGGLLPLQAAYGKPIILAVAYPAADGASTACLPGQSGECLDMSGFDQTMADIPGIQLDLQEQADIYNALFVVINQRTWLSGMVSRGWYTPVILRNVSPSLYGKPAQEVVSYWFPRLLGKPAP